MIKLINILAILFLAISSQLIAQNTLSPIVIGSQGNMASASSGNSLQYTVGEAVILTASSSGHIFTQGFNQPKTIIANNPLDVYFVIGHASCFGIHDGYILIDSVAGCDGNYTLDLNGETVNINDTIIALGSGSYQLSISSLDGCSLNETITINNVGDNCDIEFYNAFSPNGDMVNDTWIIDLVEGYPENTVLIYDRWGVLVWEGTGYDNQDILWDGKNKNGVDLPDGTYFYIFQSNDLIIKNYVEITR